MLHRLKKNPLGDTGVTTIATALAQNGSLRKLDLTDCGFKDPGMKSLADALSENTALKKLELYKNKLGDKGALHVTSILKNNETLNSMEYVLPPQILLGISGNLVYIVSRRWSSATTLSARSLQA